MKTLKQLLLAVAVMTCFSMTAAAQKDKGKDNPPPKEGKPPVIVVQPDKKPKEDKPKGDKKPGALMFYFKEEN